ncbi:hypothetical protein B0H19DRAFT_1131569 [Mycena capillaripes]|nr:hypothetical protein B0H19DRAFT_1131569 [Mycena capillaripes]
MRDRSSTLGLGRCDCLLSLIEFLQVHAATSKFRDCDACRTFSLLLAGLRHGRRHEMPLTHLSCLLTTMSTGLSLKRKIDYAMEVLQQEPLFQVVSKQRWEEIGSQVLQEFRGDISVPFTETAPFYSELFESSGARYSRIIKLREDRDAVAPSQSDLYQDAARDLQKNILWKGVREHVVISSGSSCRRAIDLMVLTAVELAQAQISADEDIDRVLGDRHALNGRKYHVAGNSSKSQSWVVLLPETDVPDQTVRPGVAFHGTLDYLLGVVDADKVAGELKTDGFLTDWIYTFDQRNIRRHAVTSVLEVKSEGGIEMESFAQAAAQGAALCVMTRRPSVINVLTNGRHWVFMRVAKNSDAVKRRRRRTASTNWTRRKNSGPTVSAASTPTSRALPETSTKPFKASRTRMLDIFEDGDLAIVLRLLTMAILLSPEEFAKSAAES